MDAPSTMQSGRIMSADEFDAYALGYKYIYCSHVVTYRTELLRQIGLELQAGISYTDNEYVFFPLSHIQSAIYYELPVYQYFVGREGQTCDPKIANKSVSQMVKVYGRLIKHYKKNKDHQIKAVLSNQQILLAELIRWIYRVCFGENSNLEKREIVDKIENDIYDEPIIYQREIGWTTRYGVDVLSYYRETGRFVTHPITKVMLTYHRFVRLIERILKK